MSHKKTKEEKLTTRRVWYYANLEKAKASAKKSREKHKEQRKADCKAWVEKNKEYVKQYHHEYNKKWYQKNKKEHDARGKIWAENFENKKKRVKYVQKYVLRNKDKVIAYRKNYERTLNGKYRQIQNRAKRFNEGIDITLENFKKIVSASCIYCGETEKPRGIDRIDNTRGYIKENSASCCKTCNFMKKALTKEQFLEHITKIYKYNK